MMIRNKSKIIVIFLISVCSLWTLAAQDLSILQIFNGGKQKLSEGIDEGNMQKIEQSLILFHRGLEINPNYFEVLKNLSIAYYMLGNTTLARKYGLEGLVQNSSDVDLVLMDIFLDLNENKLQDVKQKIDIVKEQYPFKIEILYLEIIYVALLNDQQQLDSLILQMQRKFGIENEYYYIYEILKSMQLKSTTFEEESYISKLLNIYPNQPWIQWVLANYFRLFENDDKAKEMTDTLKNSRIIMLSKYYYENTFLDRYKIGDFNGAVDIASEYSKEMPLEINAWKFMAIAYDSLNQYQYAERAFSRALKLGPDDVFLQFMYDMLLSNSGSNLKDIRKERTDMLMQEIQYAFDSGDISRTKELINMVLYIDPLLLYPKRMNARIYEQEGNFYRAQLALQEVIKRGYEEENIDELLVYYKSKVDEFSSYEVDEKLYLQSKTWTMRLKISNISDDIFVHVLYHKYLEEIMFYYMKNSYFIDWMHEYESNDIDIRYQVEVQFFDRQENTVVTVIIRNKNTEAQIFSFNKIYTKDYDYNSIAMDLSAIINSIVPHIIEVVLYDKIQSDIILNTAGLIDVEKDTFYKLYGNKNIDDFTLVQDINPFGIDVLPKGVIVVKEVGPRFSIAKIEKHESMSNSEYLNLFQNIKKGDFIVIDTVTLKDIQSESVLVNNLQNTSGESLMGYYFKNLYISSLFSNK